MININKYIAQSGISSRRGADEMVRCGRVKINGKIAKLTDKVSPNDIVLFDNKKIIPEEEKIYIAFNKPVGVITTTAKESPNNIIDFIKYPKRIFPVGRLDVNTSGLIFLTNDGDFAQLVTKSKKIEKEYLVQVDKSIDFGFLKGMENGIFLDGFRTLPAKVEKIGDRIFKITISEGKNRQIRRMCEYFGYNVTKLKRIRIGHILLGDIEEGKYQVLSQDQIKNIKS